MDGKEALGVLDGITDLYVAKGRKIVHHDLATARPPDEELLALMLGRSGKLRAPVVRTGSTLVVGYNQELLGEVLL